MSAPGRLLPLLLLLVVCAGHVLGLRAGRAAPVSAWAAAELVAPGLFARGEDRLAPPFEAPPPPGTSLAWVALAPGASATLATPFVGWIPLWLALAALLGGLPSQLGGRLAGPALLGLGAAGTALVRHPTPLVLALCLLAAAGVGLARPDPGPASARPQLAAAAACVLLTAALVGAALRAGFATDAEALQPLLSRLDAAGRADWGPARQALAAAHLRAVLDRAAVFAFAGMTALLLHLKSRAAWSAALLLVVAAADLASVVL